MDIDQFWQLTESATQCDPQSAEEWDVKLIEALKQLSADEILAWDRIFSSLTAKLYRNELWAAAYLINGGASDDGFYYFRCWLIGMGSQVCSNALRDPDSLADVVGKNWARDGIDAEAEIYSAGYQAWRAVTGAADDQPYPIQDPKVELCGEEFDFDNDEEMRRVLPRLFEKLEQ